MRERGKIEHGEWGTGAQDDGVTLAGIICARMALEAKKMYLHYRTISLVAVGLPNPTLRFHFGHLDYNESTR